MPLLNDRYERDKIVSPITVGSQQAIQAVRSSRRTIIACLPQSDLPTHHLGNTLEAKRREYDLQCWDRHPISRLAAGTVSFAR